MFPTRLRAIRVGLKGVLLLAVGIAIGFGLSLRTWQHPTGLAQNESQMTVLPLYTIEPPDILTVAVSSAAAEEAVPGEYLVAPDGTIDLGRLGQVAVSGKTIAEAQKAIENAAAAHTKSPEVDVDVFAYNSRVYYVITQRGDAGDRVDRIPIMGHETVRDAIAHIGGLPAPDVKEIFIARPSVRGEGQDTILPVQWDKIASGAPTTTNHQLMPGDRLFIICESTTTDPQNVSGRQLRRMFVGRKLTAT